MVVIEFLDVKLHQFVFLIFTNEMILNYLISAPNFNEVIDY